MDEASVMAGSMGSNDISRTLILYLLSLLPVVLASSSCKLPLSGRKDGQGRPGHIGFLVFITVEEKMSAFIVTPIIIP